jgi:hypothetical protein
VTGFIKKLFRSKPKDAETTEAIKPARIERGNAYYLNADDAQTFGNVEYMRSSKTVRHTFPKAKVGKENARIRAISYAESINSDGSLPLAPLTASQSANLGSDSVRSDASTRRRPDASLDSFRNMAREIKKS